MQKISGIGVAVSIFCVALTASVSAHVTVKPAKVATGGYQTFTTSVPNEKEIPVTAVRLIIPKGVGSVTPTVKQGWEISTVKSGDDVTEINWMGGQIGQGLRDEFTFSAQAPDKAGDIVWKAYQTYEDGSVVSWDQKPSEEHGHDNESESKGPYSTTAVNDEEVEEENSPPTAPYVMGAVAITLSIMALFRSSRY